MSVSTNERRHRAMPSRRSDHPILPTHQELAARDVSADEQPIRLDDPRSIQILATEHWSLLATRALSWNESFSRASMFLATLSAAVVALALVAQVERFGTGFVAFGLVLLPFLELVGIATFIRLGQANGDDLVAIQGMNRIRHAYLEVAPRLEPYFVTSRHDDLPSIIATYDARSLAASPFRAVLHHSLVMTQGMVGIINSIVAAAFGFLVGLPFGLAWPGAASVGAVLLAVTLALELAAGLSGYRAIRDGMDVRFPSAADDLRRASTGGHPVQPSVPSLASEARTAPGVGRS
jgi:hypothetical protein